MQKENLNQKNMQTKKCNSTNNAVTFNDLNFAKYTLQSGGIVAFPTETVYGLGADASNAQAVEKVFKAKGRPRNHPLIVHILNHEAISFWAKNIPDCAINLAKTFWPGPLTLVLEKQHHVLNEVTGGQDTVALRAPKHPLTLQLLESFKGLVGPSANKFGHVSPTLAKHVHDDFKDDIDFVLDGGQCKIGIESTIIKCTHNSIEILRQGSILQEEIERVLKNDMISVKNKASSIISTSNSFDSLNSSTRIKVPGMLKSHYAPQKPLLMLNLKDIKTFVKKINEKNNTACILSFTEKPSYIEDSFMWFQVEKNHQTYAQNLYANIRMFDKLNVNYIIIEKIPNSDSWSAILDRLTKASAKSEKYMEFINFSEALIS